MGLDSAAGPACACILRVYMYIVYIVRGAARGWLAEIDPIPQIDFFRVGVEGGRE
jgi:hypothetical protein